MECKGCGVELTEATAFMTADGAICDQCQADIDLQDLFRKGTLRYAWGAVGLACLACAFDPWAIISVFALISGVKFFMDFWTKDEDHRKGVARIGILPRVAAVLAIVISVGRMVWEALKLLGLGLLALF